MLKVDNLSYSYPEKDLYKDISFTLESGAHCAFIGVSGSGKSTLLNLITNPEKYMYDGSIDIESGSRIGYVSQFYEVDKVKDITVFDYIAEASLNLQREITEIFTEMETSSDTDLLLEKYQQALDSFDAIGGENFESIINKKLSLADLIKYKDSLLSELSGGEFKLIQVIKEMLNKPDLLIMDEPDVFLDFENLASLKSLINSHKETLLVITHNRYLLNHCFNKILHLENMELQEFDGRYIDYNLSLLEEKIELQELALADTEEIERNEILIDKLRFAASEIADSSKGKALSSRVKFQELLKERRIKAPFVNIKQPDICLYTDNEIEDATALKVSDYSVSFDELILEDVNFEIKTKDKVAIIGANGTGKTTLIRDIFENNKASIEVNEDISLAYLSQLQGEMLDESNTVLQEFFDIGFKESEDVISYLSKYSFDSDIIYQKIEALSGGEKNILQLAKISSSKSNMLLLDEPTSHLDTYSQIALEEAIANYNGAIIMISHDFYTIINSMDYVLIIEDKTIRRMNMRTFRRMIYDKYFDRDYLDIEKNIKSVETKIESALANNDFELAGVLFEELEPLVKTL